MILKIYLSVGQRGTVTVDRIEKLSHYDKLTKEFDINAYIAIIDTDRYIMNNNIYDHPGTITYRLVRSKEYQRCFRGNKIKRILDE